MHQPYLDNAFIKSGLFVLIAVFACFAAATHAQIVEPDHFSIEHSSSTDLLTVELSETQQVAEPVEVQLRFPSVFENQETKTSVLVAAANEPEKISFGKKFEDRFGESKFDKKTGIIKFPLADEKMPDPEFKDEHDDQGFRWKPAIRQSLLFLGIQHGFAIVTQGKTRRALKGKFFKDYFNSVKSLKGWDDGGRFFTNYIAHPMQGALTGFIYVQNDPKAINLKFGKSRAYWKSRLKALAWTSVWSTQFEIGPISQASLGNVGSSGKQTWEDIVVTPTVGTALLITEDALDRFVMQKIERRYSNFYLKIFGRMLLNPSRNFSNLLRFKPPWYRDRPTAR
ncbi:MAG: hypothetical protein KIS76_16845 [Pyrinomonadaceae bacterium]|nr:hypothetical protein [Pyrinomonadaceae bacterium]